MYVDLMETERKRLHRLVESTAAELRKNKADGKSRIETMVIDGSPKEVIVEEAETSIPNAETFVKAEGSISLTRASNASRPPQPSIKTSAPGLTLTASVESNSITSSSFDGLLNSTRGAPAETTRSLSSTTRKTFPPVGDWTFTAAAAGLCLCVADSNAALATSTSCAALSALDRAASYSRKLVVTAVCAFSNS